MNQVSRADALELTLEEPKLLDPDGEYPDFSPDGSHILFDKGNCLWLIAKDGGSERKLTCNATAGSFSSDGSKIAFISPSKVELGEFQGTLSVLDLKTGKALLLDSSWTSLPRLYWAKNDSKVFGLRGRPDYGNGIEVLDLQTLKHDEHDGDLGSRVEYEWVRYSGGSPFPSNVDLVDQRVDQPTYGGEFGPAGIWAVNVKDSTSRWSAETSKKLLLAGKYVQLRLSPDLSTIAFSKDTGEPFFYSSLPSQWDIPGRGVYVAALERQTRLVERKFSVPIGTVQMRLSCALEGAQVYADVNGPRINPLNGKTVGPNDTQKAVVHFTRIFDENSYIQVVSEAQPVSAGDVLTRMWIAEKPDCNVDVSDKFVLVKPEAALLPAK